MTRSGLSEASDGKASNQPMVGKRIKINGHKYRIHPVYDEYGANRRGNVVLIPKSRLINEHYNNKGYIQFCLFDFKNNNISNKKALKHRFIYECYYGVIPKGMVIDHLNDDKKDNRLCNLQLMSKQQNCKKLAANRNCKKVKATNLETNEVSYYKSQYSTHKHLHINQGTVSNCCRGINYHKLGTSKKDGCKYAFEYA